MWSRARAVFYLSSHLPLLFPFMLVVCIIEVQEHNSKFYTLNLAEIESGVSDFWFYMTGFRNLH